MGGHYNREIEMWVSSLERVVFGQAEPSSRHVFIQLCIWLSLRQVWLVLLVCFFFYVFVYQNALLLRLKFDFQCLHFLCAWLANLIMRIDNVYSILTCFFKMSMLASYIFRCIWEILSYNLLVNILIIRDGHVSI